MTRPRGGSGRRDGEGGQMPAEVEEELLIPRRTPWADALARAAVFSLRYWSWPFRYWNWKSAAISAALRGSVFLLAAGQHTGQKGAAVEIAYVVANSGFFCAMQQGMLGLRPRWAGNLGIVVAIPAVAQACDSWLHLAMGAPSPHGFTAGMLVFSFLSALFHLHMMQNGAMLVGEGSRSFVADLKAVPMLVVSFVGAPVKWIAAMVRSSLPEVDWETGAAD